MKTKTQKTPSKQAPRGAQSTSAAASARGLAEAEIAALRRSQAMIAFTPKGEILDANENFLKVMGYSLDEVVGRHHRMFVDPTHAATEEYAGFWRALGAGEFQVAEFRRFARGGREVWIQGSYNPVFDAAGRVQRVVKVATDITEQSAAKPNRCESDKKMPVYFFAFEVISCCQQHPKCCAHFLYRGCEYE